MLFMVHIKVDLPTDWTPEKISEVYVAETERGMQMMREKKVLRGWRIVGEMANYSIWQAETLEDLHANLQSLPLWRFMDVDVTPIIKHPTTEAYEKRFGALPNF
jgi:muconolactone D-isomerase